MFSKSGTAEGEASKFGREELGLLHELPRAVGLLNTLLKNLQTRN